MDIIDTHRYSIYISQQQPPVHLQEDEAMNGYELQSGSNVLRCICSTNRYSMYISQQQPPVHLQEDEAMDGMAADDASPASAVRERYERMFKEKQQGPGKGLAGGGLPGDPAAAALAAQGQAVRTAFQGSISSVFTKHLRYAPHSC